MSLTAIALASWLTAAAPQEPQLRHLGPPGPAVAVDAADGLGAGEHECALRIDRRAPAADLVAALANARRRGVQQVLVAASLPDGTPGALAIGLEDPAVVGERAPVRLRAHRGLPGVAARGVVPLLQRWQRGWTAQLGKEFAVAVEVPADATAERVLELVEALAEAGVPSVAIDLAAPAPGAAPAAVDDGLLALAIDEPLPIRIQPPREPPPRPRRDDRPFGCVPSPSGAAAGDPANAPAAAAPAIALGGSDAEQRVRRALVVARQRDDGSFDDGHGGADLTAAALLALTVLGDGAVGEPADRAALCRALGWLLARQSADGSFGLPGPGGAREHAVATVAMLEAAGQLGNSGGASLAALLRGSGTDALRWLFAQREPDGGWTDAGPATPSDPLTSAWAQFAIANAQSWHFDLPERSADLVAWFDRHPQKVPVRAAAELMCRAFAGHDRATDARMDQLRDLLAAEADAGDPTTAYWTTYALLACGGEAMQQWSQRLTAALAAPTPATGDVQGMLYRLLARQVLVRMRRLRR